ncbi:MAG: hypothetical protein E7773_06545 [Sphingomonas sp.]|uniref:hypothetical protein n=1 Tax=Sphingomonas sp. TaxID=28214 RepID=UPI0012260669|nr:hypothetical protein [Sphingomonas sp.]THD36660.1 MAG: hypothetical protein E7773_06545 [Sphingomonas sp.]
MIIPFAMIIANTAFPAATGVVKCDLPATASMTDVIDVLSHRAIDAVDRARSRGWKDDFTLASVVAPSADFSLGGGDVGRPLGTGVQGLRAMALNLRADSFRFSTWSGTPPPPANACSEWKMDVEFIDSKSSVTSTIKFSFRDGRIVSASGWKGFFAAGPLKEIER